MLGLIRELQERLNNLTLMTLAILSSLAERDEGFTDVYAAKAEEMEGGEVAQKFASALATLDQLVERMNADLR